MGQMQTHGNYLYDETCPKCVDADAQAAQPDRPEPVDPASVRVGGGSTCNIATVRILQRPEPDPDEAEISALDRVFTEAFEAASNARGRWAPEDVVREMHSRGVRVVSSDE